MRKNSYAKYSYRINGNTLIFQKKVSDLNKKDIEIIKKKYLDTNNYHLILKDFGKNKFKILNNIKLFSKIFGKTLSQDMSGKKIVTITPNLKKINSIKNNKIKVNLRYHQTNKGGFIHTDGPQLKKPPKYVLMGCVNNSTRGGNSILSSINKIYLHLKKKDKKTFNILKNNFFFEKRGFYNKERPEFLFKPIIQFVNRDLRFRYLRDYMNQAYNLKSIKISKLKYNALDKLDNLLNSKKFQYVYKLKKGDVLLLNNYKLAHGRSSFKLDNNKRSLIRIWFAK